jgi:hypothetical protein
MSRSGTRSLWRVGRPVAVALAAAFSPLVLACQGSGAAGRSASQASTSGDVCGGVDDVSCGDPSLVCEVDPSSTDGSGTCVPADPGADASASEAPPGTLGGLCGGAAAIACSDPATVCTSDPTDPTTAGTCVGNGAPAAADDGGSAGDNGGDDAGSDDGGPAPGTTGGSCGGTNAVPCTDPNTTCSANATDPTSVGTCVAEDAGS